MPNIHVKLIFDDWKKDNVSIYNTEKGADLATGNFSIGALFTATIELDITEHEELKKAIAEGYTPTFSVAFK